jgi:uncharacterized metal-binding protein
MKGSAHTTVTLAASLGLLFIDPVMAAGCASGVILSPDLDCDMGYIGLAHLRNIPAGRVISKLWEWFWKPYSLFFAHRSMSSHGLVISTIIRVVYLAIPLLVLNIWIPMTIPAWIGRAIIGLMVSDILHTVTDSLFKN